MAKTKCPGCGAKNDAASYRCRICTAVINPDAALPQADEPAPAPPVVAHFDPNEINRQVRPAREQFGSGRGALAARLAAVQGGSPAPETEAPPSPTPDGPTFAPAQDVIEPVDVTEPIVVASAPPSAAPIQYEAEPFDADALFRDKG